MSAHQVAVLLQEHGSSRGPSDAGDASDTNDCRRQRTDLLAAVLSSCRAMWSTKSEELDSVAEALGDGSRDVAWRLPYGDAGILEFFVALLAEGHLRQELHIHALRLIGNACADTNENRARLVEQSRLLSVTKHVADESLLSFNIPVLYNVLVDYEPAQILASKSGLSKQLLGLLMLPNIFHKYAPFVPYVCKILALLVTQDGEAAAADPTIVGVLLTLADQPEAKEDVDDFVSLAAVALAYLASEALQHRLIADDQVMLLLAVFYHAHVGIDYEAIDDEDLVAQVKQLRSSLLSALADVSGNDSFARTYSLSNGVPQTLLDWLRGGNDNESKKNLFLQSAACLALGNVSRSDAASIALVQDYRAHEPLVKLISDPDVTDSQFLHAACSFLKNLAIPLGNKSQLADLLLPQCVPRLYSLDTVPQLQFAAVSLTRLLLLNCTANVWQICTPPLKNKKETCSSPCPASSAKSDDHDNDTQTSANSIIALYGRSDAEPTRLEAARCVAAICRALHSMPVSENLSPVSVSATESLSSPLLPQSHHSPGERQRQAFYATHSVQQPLRFLITQNKWPSLKSEAWFVLALMSRSDDGARIVLSLLLDDAAAEASLREAITGTEETEETETEETEEKEGETLSVANSIAQVGSAASSLRLEPRQVNAEQKARMTVVDAENALILCTELAKRAEGTLPAEKLELLQKWVRDGTRVFARRLDN
ncbi:hypothetical protein E4U15_003307 [Claviceps sp. LM218 group G6]|nr:hypothetical protein E4U15_003307 [Claviceps sp. LM218 group G6]